MKLSSLAPAVAAAATLAIALLGGAAAHAGDSTISQDARQIGHTVSRDAKQVGHQVASDSRRLG
ncbi:MAG TPA: hypothetical protein VHE11_10670, partial [Steroidobacteraceae bacterium]|nr:hypothetical protein [Steroidobacteraceae bacterium]